jgi:ectoine hydroxylase-related dioxygenase (phytanoyl-CoA dioxygenase family)
MELANWEATADLNEIYADIRRLELEQCIGEFDAFGFTVIPPEKVAPHEFHIRLRDAILAVHERRTGHHIDPEALSSSRLEHGRPLSTLWGLLGEDEVFEKALMNPSVYAMARYLCGRQVLLSDSIALIKQDDPTPTHPLHIDQAGTPPPMPAYQQVINITWALTDYTRDNGAVAIVPGSHRFGRMPMPYEEDFLREGAPVRAYPIECEAGSLIIWGGTTWHGSFPRHSPGLRVTLIQAFCRSYMKQVRDFPRDTPKEVLERNSPAFAQLIGINSLYPIDSKTGIVDLKKKDEFLAAGKNPWA